MDLRKLIDRIGKTSLPFDAVLQQFLSPDQGKIEDELRLARRAEKAGKDNTPVSDARSKDSLALEIDTYLHTILRKAKKELDDHLHGLVGIDSNQTNEAHANEIRDITRAALNSVREACRNGVNKLFPHRKRVADGERALERFRMKHGLDRPADNPENPNRIYGIIFFLFTLELALNAYTLGTAHPEGPLGVVLETFMIAALNITIGFTSGWLFWREIGHHYTFRKILGLVGSASLLVVTLAGNLAVGHYRDAILSISARALELGAVGFVKEISMLGGAVKESFMSHAFELHDFKSYLTVCVGIFLALYAAKKGFDADDRYPGYGRLSREQDGRNADYSDLFARLQGELTEIARRATQENNTIGQLAENAQAARQSHVQTAERLISAFNDWTKEIDSVGRSLYAKYREINEQHRTTPRPSCFDIEFSLPPSLLKAPSYVAASSVNSAININGLIDKCSDKINTALNGYLGVYRTIGELAPEDLTQERASSFDVEVEKIYREISKGLGDEGPDDG